MLCAVPAARVCVQGGLHRRRRARHRLREECGEGLSGEVWGVVCVNRVMRCVLYVVCCMLCAVRVLSLCVCLTNSK